MDTTTPRAFAVVAIDETRDWAPEYADACGRIFTLYAYDPSAPVHACELRASYEMHPIGFEPARLPADDAEAERIREGIDETAALMDCAYMHTSAVDRIAPELRELREFDADATIDDALEGFHANAPYLRGIVDDTPPDGVEMWRERVRYSDCCDTPAPESYATACEGQPCPSCETAATWRYATPRTDPETEMGWFFWYCSPGCLPDSDAFGPYNSEGDAIAAAWDFSGDGC